MPFEQTREGEPRGLVLKTRSFDFKRVFVALLFVPLLYVLVRYLPVSAFFVLVVATALAALWEFYRLHFAQQPRPIELSLAMGSMGLLLATLQWPGMMPDQSYWVVALFLVVTGRLLSARDHARTMTDCAILLFGVVYIGVTLGHLLLIRALPDGVFLVFFLALVTWSGDTGAYYVGRNFGRRKLAPLTSPNKTVEGLLGGFALATIIALVARAWFLPAFSIGDCLALGLLLTGAGAVGDLAESAMKRSAGVKDSGTILPGHGGILDRVDSLLFTAPTFYYYVTLLKGASFL